MQCCQREHKRVRPCDLWWVGWCRSERHAHSPHRGFHNRSYALFARIPVYTAIFLLLYALEAEEFLAARSREVQRISTANKPLPINWAAGSTAFICAEAGITARTQE